MGSGKLSGRQLAEVKNNQIKGGTLFIFLLTFVLTTLEKVTAKVSVPEIRLVQMHRFGECNQQSSS